MPAQERDRRARQVYRTAGPHDTDTVVRITADCPFITPAVIDRVVGLYEASNVAYVTNIIEYTYPEGLDVKAVDNEALEQA